MILKGQSAKDFNNAMLEPDEKAIGQRDAFIGDIKDRFIEYAKGFGVDIEFRNCTPEQGDTFEKLFGDLKI